MENNIFNEASSTLIDLDYGKTQLDLAIEWARANNIVIILPTKDLDELEEDWNLWNQMDRDRKRKSDDKSMELFGMDNQHHYMGLINRFYNVNIEDDLTPDTYITSNDILESFTNMVNSISKDNSYSNTLNIINKTKENLKRINTINEYNIGYFSPYFLPEKIQSLGSYSLVKNQNYYDEIADNLFLDKERTIPTKKWFEEYILNSNGFITENTELYMRLWKEKLENLYSDYNTILQENDIQKINARKQSILELGWNPEIDFNTKNRIKCNIKLNHHIESLYESTNIVDLSKLVISNPVDIISEKTTDEDNKLYPIYIVLSYTYTNFGKLISKVTKFNYTHAAFSLDSSLKNLFSFNAYTQNRGGFSLESIKNYPNKNGKSRLAVFCIFIKKMDLLKIKNKLNEFLNNIKDTSYSFITAIGLIFNKPIQFANSMICTQFVDFLLKSINVDITNKPSAIVQPKDYFIAKKNNNKIYQLYEGLLGDYDEKKVNKLIKKLQIKAQYIKENTEIINESQFLETLSKSNNNLDTILYLNENTSILENQEIFDMYNIYIKEPLDIQPFLEVKHFPAGFDKDGNLIIKKKKKLDFEAEYARSHKLLKIYEKQINYYAAAYEICKLWYMNILLEDKIYNEKNTEEDIVKYHKARAKILNDFNKYLNFILQHDKKFNFIKYYENTPFSDNKLKISKHTIYYSGKLLKDIIKGLIIK